MKVMNIKIIQKNNKFLNPLKIKEVQEYEKNIFPIMKELEEIEKNEIKPKAQQNSQLESFSGNKGFIFRLN